MGEHGPTRLFGADSRLALGLASPSKMLLVGARAERIPTGIVTLERVHRGCRPGAPARRCSARSLLGDLVSVEVELEPRSLRAVQNQLVSLPSDDPQ